MRSGEWLLITIGLLFSACSGDYPLPPTACDNYCHATKGMQCQFYEPAACVSDCEREERGSEVCRAQLDAVVTCFIDYDAADKRCASYGSYLIANPNAGLCDAQINELEVCSSIEREKANPQL